MTTTKTNLFDLFTRSRAGVTAALVAGALSFGLTPSNAQAGETIEVESRTIEIEMEHGELSAEDRAMIAHDEALTIYSDFENMKGGDIDVKRRKDGDVEAKYKTPDGTKVSMSVESDGEVEVERRNRSQRFKYDYEKDEDGKVEIEIDRRGKLAKMEYEYDRDEDGYVESEYEGPASHPTTVVATDTTVTQTPDAPEQELRDNFARVHFDFDKSDLDWESRQLLDRNAEILKEHSDVRVTIQGHTDEAGSDSYNMALGDRRAQSVFSYLVNQGVSASQLTTVTQGESNPLVDVGEQRLQANRRAEFIVTSGSDVADSSANNTDEQRRYVPARG
jgi:peptidoglycan-associated lipoprotein